MDTPATHRPEPLLITTQDQGSPNWMRRTSRRLRWAARSVLVEHTIYLPIARRHYPAEPEASGEFAAARVLRNDSELVIEGFPRCGNTFAVTAFRMSQTRPVRLANHLHAPAQIIAAVKRRVPTLVLIRDPEDAAVSFMIQNNGYLSAAQVLQWYARFYRRIVPYSEGFVLASFEQVTSDFGAVVASVNARFGTFFDVFPHTDENVRTCFDTIEADSRKVHQGQIRELGVARPSDYRQTIKEGMIEELRAERVRVFRDRAYDVYRMLIQRLHPGWRQPGG